VRFDLEYTSFESIPFFSECSAEVDKAGYRLVELHIESKKNASSVVAVIASKNPAKDIGVADCSKAHRTLLPKIASLLHKSEDEISMEMCSPGIERNIKNAAEFKVFQGREIRVWDKNSADWIRGTVDDADENCVVLQTEDGGKKSVSYIDIAKAKFIHS
jgi:ribosome maturation factor RimP